MKILVIEDDPGLAGFYKMWLSRLGDVTVTANLEEAFAMIDEATELITLDLNLMPNSGTRQTLARISEIKSRAPKALLIVLTACMSQEESKEAIAAGADGFIHKGDVHSERGMFKKLSEFVGSFMTAPPKMEQHLQVLEMIAKKTGEYFKNNQTQKLQP